ncbi:MAG: hypothetical protein HY892_02830 [Deltaproteobacteria bacterium]|nr:hypothetical protein [Deltaproteobacteria bacterium]
MSLHEDKFVEICRKVAEELNRSQDWKLSSDEREELARRVEPHAAAAGEARLAED